MTSLDDFPAPALAALAAFLDHHGDRAGEAAWLAGLAMIERVGVEAREGIYGRWRHYPAGELRRVRRDVAAALSILRVAVSLQEAENANMRELTTDLAQRAATVAAERRRDQTREAERVRLLRATARKEGRAPTDAELYPWMTD